MSTEFGAQAIRAMELPLTVTGKPVTYICGFVLFCVWRVRAGIKSSGSDLIS